MTSTQKRAAIRFESLEARHIQDILAIEQVTNPAPWSEVSFKSELSNPSSVFFVAVLGNDVVGFAGAWVVIDEAHVTTVAVSPNAQRQGIGEALMRELLARCKDAGCTCSTLEVRSQNDPAIKLYEKLGYVACATRRNYYPNNDDATVMWLHGL